MVKQFARIKPEYGSKMAVLDRVMEEKHILNLSMIYMRRIVVIMMPVDLNSFYISINVHFRLIRINLIGFNPIVRRVRKWHKPPHGFALF